MSALQNLMPLAMALACTAPALQAAQGPYGGAARAIPGVIQVIDYDTGGEGVAYHDTSSGNGGGQYRSEDVDIVNDGSGGLAIGWTANGEWLEYTVDVAAGTYDLVLSAASPGGADLIVSLDGQTLGTIQVTSTGSFTSFANFTLRGISLAGGTGKVLRLTLSGGGADLYDLKSITFSKAGTTVGDPGKPSGVSFDYATIQRKMYGDNFCLTWAADGNLYTPMDDGNARTWQGEDPDTFKSDRIGSQFLKITGGADFTDDDVHYSPGWTMPDFLSPFYAYGALSVEGRMYSWLWLSDQTSGQVDRGAYRRPIANRLLYTDDYGQTFHRWNGTKVTAANFSDTNQSSFFFYKEDPTPKAGRDAYAFNWITFLQAGQDYSLAKDDYVYMYAVEQKDVSKLSLIRVHKSQVTDRSAYRYLSGVSSSGAASWSSNMDDRVPTISYPEKDANGRPWIWSSWYPDVVYNQGLDCYMMISYGISEDRDRNYWDNWCENCTRSSTVGMWYAEKPWGPWKRFFYKPNFKVGQNAPDDPLSRTYQWKFNPRLISADGKTMQVIWNDAGDNHGVAYYAWNQMTVQIQTTPDDGGSGDPATTTAITGPASGSSFTPGQTVTATGSGDNLSWHIDLLFDGKGAFATGSGSSITFTVPSNATTDQNVQIRLSGDGGTVEQLHQIVSAPSSEPCSCGSLRVNFQPAGSPIVAGWRVDSGAVFADRGNGQSYGWSTANGETRDRNAVQDQLQDTFNHLQKNGRPSWEIAVPDGKYLVTLVSGDASYSDQLNHLEIEGVAVRDPDGEDAFDRHDAIPVTVSDGRLTVQAAADGSNSKICWIQIDRVTSVDLAINFQPASAPVPAGHLPDSGAVFADRGNGWSYGWNALTDETRDRNIASDQRYDSLNHLQKPANPQAVWELELPNGYYELRIVCSDPGYTDQLNHLLVEGHRLADPDGQDHVDAFLTTIELRDGRLTLTAAADASNAKIAFIEVRSLPDSSG